MKFPIQHSQSLASAGVIAGALIATPFIAQAQSAADANPRTPWGAPDIAGVYAEYTTAPLQRSEEYGNREFLTDDQHHPEVDPQRSRLAPLRREPE